MGEASFDTPEMPVGVGDVLALGALVLVRLLLRCLGGEQGGAALLRQLGLVLLEAREDAAATRPDA